VQINGVPVVDSKKPLVITITKSDVKLGDTKDPGACAAARCLLRQPNVEMARVHIGRTYIKIGKQWLRYKTTPPLRQEIVTFDRGGEFAPGTYTLKPLSEWEVASGRRQGSSAKGARDKGSKNRTPTKPRRKYHTVANVRSKGANR